MKRQRGEQEEMFATRKSLEEWAPEMRRALASPVGWRALSLTAPWPHAILDESPLPKRVENRDWPHGSSFRGPVMIAASAQALTWPYEQATAFAAERGLAWRPPAFDTVERGGIVGVACLYDTVRTAADFRKGYIAPEQIAWWMGSFAFTLGYVARTDFVPCKGALGFWRVPEDVAARALARFAREGGAPC